MTRPPGFEELSDEDFAALIEGAVEERENMSRKFHDEDGRKFLGRNKVLKQSRYAKPRTREPRFEISPKVACRDKTRRIAHLLANRDWRARYRAALAAWRCGHRDVVFPEGTYLMRVRHNVNVASARGPD